MALIGNMQYLTIGDKTYRIASSSLPIASASTLGGIKVGTGLTIDSTTGVLSATGTSVTIDNALSDSSTNPVQNKVIKTALDNKANSTDVPTKTSDLTNDSNFMSGMTILSYGISTWNDFITAYKANHVVYCRASSNANPASGSQTRMAFMAYVSDATNPTNVEFQYYRSVSSHTASQQGDQVYVYKLTSGNAWTVTVREASVKITTGSSKGINAAYSNGAVTIGHTNSVTAKTTQALYPITYDAQGHITGSGTAVTIPTIPTNISTFTNDAGYLTSYTETDPIFSASAAAGITSSDITSWNNKISDDKTWNGVTLDKTGGIQGSSIYLAARSSTSSTTAYQIQATSTPTQQKIALYDTNSYLNSTTPTAGDSSTKVATTAFVAGVVPTKVSDLTNDSGYVTTDEKVKLTSNTGSTAVNIVLGPTSITSGTAYNCLYNTNLKYTPSTGNLQTTQLNGVTVGSSPKFTDTVTTVTLNGSTTSTPSFYAPTSIGTSGYFLKSNGSGAAPTWVSPPSGVFIAEYDSTSYASIVTAINNDENVIIHDDSLGYDLYGILVDKGGSQNSIGFFAVDSSLNIGIDYRVYEDDSWKMNMNYEFTDSMLSLAQSQPTTSTYGIIFGTGTSARTRQYDLTGKIDTNATNAGLRYQNKYLYAPGLYVGDLDLTITNSEYTTLMTSLDAI